MLKKINSGTFNKSDYINLASLEKEEFFSFMRENYGDVLFEQAFKLIETNYNLIIE